MSWARRHATGLLALLLGLIGFSAIFYHAPRVGYTRDESFYFAAAESYAGWFQQLGRDADRALSEPVIRRHYENNREHPVLIKNLMALAYLALAPEPDPRPAGRTTERAGAYGRAMRLPAQVFSALALVLTFLLGTAVASRRVGLVAALAFLLAPRHFFHAQLACFDMPAVTVWLAVVLAWRRARSSAGWALLTGLAWGLALATKHNSFFILPVLGLHWLLVEGRALSLDRRGLHLPRIPLALIAMLIFGPLIFIGHWPFLWHDTLERLGWYFGFHLDHVNYHWEYFGRLLTDPPFPWAYPFAVTALTLPLPTLLLGGWGFFAEAGRRLGRPLAAAGGALARLAGLRTPAREERGARTPAEPALGRSDAWLLLLNAFIPFAVIALPAVPIFGGVKHWMHAMPFVCVLGALALERMIDRLPAHWHRGRRRPAWSAGLAALALAPSLAGLLWIGPYGTSFYNALAGGTAGAADLGMQRQYWSNNVTGVLPWLNENLPPGARVFFHEVTGKSFAAYKRDGWLRADVRPAWGPQRADFCVYQYHREFVDVQYRIWNLLGHRSIAHGLYLDQVPIVLVYDCRDENRIQRPRPGGAQAR